MRRLTSPQTLGLSHYQYLVYAYSGIVGTKSYGRRGAPSSPAKEGENRARGSRIVIAKVYFEVYVPLFAHSMQLSCGDTVSPSSMFAQLDSYPLAHSSLLSLALHRTLSLSKPVPAYIASRIESDGRISLVPFRSFYMREYAYIHTCIYAVVYAVRS